MAIQAVIFDRDNTLLHFNPAGAASLEARMHALVPDLAIDLVQSQWQNWPGPWPQQIADEPAFWLQFWAQLARHHPLDQALLPELSLICADYHLCMHAYDDAAQCIQALHQAGLRLGLLTNFELPSIERTLQHAGIDPAWFAVLRSSGMLGTWKPDPRAYQAMADALGLPMSACAFVDDLPANVAVARSLGMRAYQIDRSQPAHDRAANRLCFLDPEVLLADALE